MSASLEVDISSPPSDIGVDDGYDRRLLFPLIDHAPDGVHIVVRVGERTYVAPDTARLLHELDGRCNVRIVGTDQRAVDRYFKATETGETPW
ncbi:hypothetical protein [Nocardioides marinquilinus]|uniref:hypothetical protein n=1 Tax=Nocardioides marinquilinus TaxID=1210400 RepID=UPI0031E6440F